MKGVALDGILAILAVLCVVQISVSSNLIKSPFVSYVKNDLLYDLAMGYIVSYIFYLLVVVVPEQRLRRDLQSWLLADYRRFKIGLIEIYLSAIGDPWDSELPDTLLDPNAFSDYFSDRYNASQTRWHAVHNGLYEYGLPQIVVECEIFVRELQFARLRSKNVSSMPLERLNSISRMLTRIRITQPEYDDIKRLLLVLFPIHCPWSTLDGEVERDAIADFISAV